MDETDYSYMPVELLIQLNGLCINDAVRKGIISSVCDEEGNFFVQSIREDGAFDAIINSYRLQCSKKLIEEISDGLPKNFGQYFGDLCIYSFTDKSGLKAYRLCRLPYLNYSDTEGVYIYIPIKA